MAKDTNEYGVSKKSEEDVEEYIKKEIAKGFRGASIKEVLTERGYPLAFVENVFDTLENEGRMPDLAPSHPDAPHKHFLAGRMRLKAPDMKMYSICYLPITIVTFLLAGFTRGYSRTTSLVLAEAGIIAFAVPLVMLFYGKALSLEKDKRDVAFNRLLVLAVAVTILVTVLPEALIAVTIGLAFAYLVLEQSRDYMLGFAKSSLMSLATIFVSLVLAVAGIALFLGFTTMLGNTVVF